MLFLQVLAGIAKVAFYLSLMYLKLKSNPRVGCCLAPSVPRAASLGRFFPSELMLLRHVEPEDNVQVFAAEAMASTVKATGSLLFSRMVHAAMRSEA